MYYKNCSNTVRRFFGVEFMPGEIKYVPGVINFNGFRKVKNPKTDNQIKDLSEKPIKSTKRKNKKKNTSTELDVEKNVIDIDSSIDSDLDVNLSKDEEELMEVENV